jgi:hypothetical protein
MEPTRISWAEIAGWSQTTGNTLTPWELKTLRQMDGAWLTAQRGKGSGKTHQAVGEYCNGVEVENCRKVFGSQLERVCSTCPD